MPGDNKPFTRIQGLNSSSVLVQEVEEIFPKSVSPLPDYLQRRGTRNHLWVYTKEKEDQTLRDVIQILIHGSKQLSTRTWWVSVTWQLSTRDTNQTRSEPNPQSDRFIGETVTHRSHAYVYIYICIGILYIWTMYILLHIKIVVGTEYTVVFTGRKVPTERLYSQVVDIYLLHIFVHLDIYIYT